MQRGADLERDSPNDNWGHSLEISSDGQTLVIGNTWSSSNGDDFGRVKTYHWDGSDWSQMGSTIEGTSEVAIGYSVAISCDGKTIGFGALSSDTSDSVSVYSWDGTTWNPVGSPIIGEAPEDLLGKTVSLSCDGRIIAAGATFSGGGDSRTGHVRIFKWNEEVWSQVGTNIDGGTEYDCSATLLRSLPMGQG